MPKALNPLPYQAAKGLFKPEYLPNLPNYENK